MSTRILSVCPVTWLVSLCMLSLFLKNGNFWGAMQVGWHHWTEMVNVSAFALFVGDFPWVLRKGFWLCSQSSKDMIMTMWLHLWPIKTCEKLSSQIGLSAGSCSNSVFPSRIKMAATALSFVVEWTKDLISHDISLIMCHGIIHWPTWLSPVTTVSHNR